MEQAPTIGLITPHNNTVPKPVAYLFRVAYSQHSISPLVVAKLDLDLMSQDFPFLTSRFKDEHVDNHSSHRYILARVINLLVLLLEKKSDPFKTATLVSVSAWFGYLTRVSCTLSVYWTMS